MSSGVSNLAPVFLQLYILTLTHNSQLTTRNSQLVSSPYLIYHTTSVIMPFVYSIEEKTITDWFIFETVEGVM